MTTSVANIRKDLDGARRRLHALIDVSVCDAHYDRMRHYGREMVLVDMSHLDRFEGLDWMAFDRYTAEVTRCAQDRAARKLAAQRRWLDVAP